MKKTYTICTIGGDGIGPEVTAETVRLLTATSVPLTFLPADAGFGAYQKYGYPLPEHTLTTCRKSDAILFGAVTTPPEIEGYFSPIVRLRKTLNLFANVRPIKSLPIKTSRKKIDFIIVRENTEDLYGGRERTTPDGVIAERVITRLACERIVQFAFNLARSQGKKSVTVVHKANVLRKSDGLFLESARKIAADFTDISMNDMLVDATAMQLIKNPQQFEVIVTTNMFGDILSDEASALIGGLGVAASANIGESTGLFEPVHGSAPKYVGMNKANPTATFLAAVMMLEFLKEFEAAQRVRKAILTTIKSGTVTADLGGSTSTTDFTNAIISSLQQI